MLGLFWLRIYRKTFAAGAALALVTWVVSAAPFWEATSAPALKSAPQFTVNRFRKGDRLPTAESPAVWHDPPVPQGLQSEKKVPLGCDPAFSPVATPAAKSIYGRCTV